ncbi:MAG: helix-turn-helix domain-containing protein, partial [Gammaproteobacteria bacterium]
VRDLRQVAARMLSRYAGVGPITVGCIPPEDRPIGREYPDRWGGAPLESAIRLALARGASLKTIGRESENIAIRIALDEAGGNLKRAAMRLGVTDRTLQLWRAARRQNGLVVQS